MRRFAWLLTILMGTLSAPLAQGAEASRVDGIFNRLQPLVAEYYPKATFQRSAGSFQCRFNTRTFKIHHRWKTGEWQEARDQEGPDRGGILCTVDSGKGPYSGAAVTPQTFDHCYFKSLLLTPYCKSIDTRLEARLQYPDNVSPKFLERFNKLIEGFDGEFKGVGWQMTPFCKYEKKGADIAPLCQSLKAEQISFDEFLGVDASKLDEVSRHSFQRGMPTVVGSQSAVVDLLRRSTPVTYEDWHHKYSHVANKDQHGYITTAGGARLIWMLRPGGLGVLVYPDGGTVFLAME